MLKVRSAPRLMAENNTPVFIIEVNASAINGNSKNKMPCEQAMASGIK